MDAEPAVLPGEGSGMALNLYTVPSSRAFSSLFLASSSCAFWCRSMPDRRKGSGVVVGLELGVPEPAASLCRADALRPVLPRSDAVRPWLLLRSAGLSFFPLPELQARKAAVGLSRLLRMLSKTGFLGSFFSSGVLVGVSVLARAPPPRKPKRRSGLLVLAKVT